jgi:hypothetical protein
MKKLTLMALSLFALSAHAQMSSTGTIMSEAPTNPASVAPPGSVTTPGTLSGIPTLSTTPSATATGAEQRMEENPVPEPGTGFGTTPPVGTRNPGFLPGVPGGASTP